MSKLQYANIFTNIKGVKYIEKLQITQKFNEHATLELLLLMEESVDHKQILESTKVIQVYNAGEEKGAIFQGIILKGEIKHSGKLYFLRIKGISFSYLLDVQRNCASFQDTSSSYLSIIKSVIKKYDNAAVIDRLTEGKITEQILLQYQETDWSFIKRLASHFYSGVIVDATQNSPKFILGAYGIENAGKLEEFSYVLEKDIAGYMQVSQNGKADVSEKDFMYYKIESEEDFPIGGIVSYQKDSFYLKEKYTKLERGRILHTYLLAPKTGFLVEKYWNMDIIGLSLKGKVLSVNCDKVKVHLEVDPSQDEGKAYEFLYTTMYAAEGHAGWYCMPEQNDIVQIYFPAKEEAEAVAMESLRQSEEPVSAIGDPAVKLLRTAEGKEIKISKEGITITCCNGENKKTGEKNVIYIDLKDSSGIKLTSTKSVSITADEDLTLTSKKKLILSAEDEITLKCKTSQIKLDQTSADIAAKEVKIN